MSKRINDLLQQIEHLKLENVRLKTQTSQTAWVDQQMARLCLVGCGNIAGEHLTAIRDMKPYPLFRITCVVDPDSRRTEDMVARIVGMFAPAYQHAPPKQFTSLSEALLEDTKQEGGLFDAVDVMVPNFNQLHQRIACESLKNLKHTLLEKPIEVTMKGALVR